MGTRLFKVLSAVLIAAILVMIVAPAALPASVANAQGSIGTTCWAGMEQRSYNPGETNKNGFVCQANGWWGSAPSTPSQPPAVLQQAPQTPAAQNWQQYAVQTSGWCRYMVQARENWGSIALNATVRITPDELARGNGRSVSDFLPLGTEIKVPCLGHNLRGRT